MSQLHDRASHCQAVVLPASLAQLVQAQLHATQATLRTRNGCQADEDDEADAGGEGPDGAGSLVAVACSGCRRSAITRIVLWPMA